MTAPSTTGTTPTYGLPYPEPTSFVTVGAADIKALAVAVEAKLPQHPNVFVNYPPHNFSGWTACGTITIPNPGVWMIAYDSDVNPPVGNGYVEIDLTDVSGNSVGFKLLPAKLMEGQYQNRAFIVGMQIVAVPVATTYYLRFATYNNTARDMNGGGIRAWCLGPI